MNKLPEDLDSKHPINARDESGFLPVAAWSPLPAGEGQGEGLVLHSIRTESNPIEPQKKQKFPRKVLLLAWPGSIARRQVDDERFLRLPRREEGESPCGALTDEQQRQAQIDPSPHGKFWA